MALNVDVQLEESEFMQRFGDEVKKNAPGEFIVPDGVVDWDEWNRLPLGRRVVILLKEPYGWDESCAENYLKMMRGEINNISSPRGPTCKGCAAWSYGIQNTHEDFTAKWAEEELTMENRVKWLRKVALVNLKKTSGDTKSNNVVIENWAVSHAERILQQLKLINPDVIVCGYTANILLKVLKITDADISRKHAGSIDWYKVKINGKEVTVIDSYHPSYRTKSVSYLGVVEAFRQSIRELHDGPQTLRI